MAVSVVEGPTRFTCNCPTVSAEPLLALIVNGVQVTPGGRLLQVTVTLPGATPFVGWMVTGTFAVVLVPAVAVIGTAAPRTTVNAGAGPFTVKFTGGLE